MGFNRDKNGGFLTWWDRFRFGCKTLKEVFWNSIPTKPPNNAQEITAKSKLFFILSMKRSNTRDIWDFCLGGFKGDFYRFYL
ncbi:hypothetical protein HpBTM70_11670 [Helicobacter pylori]